LRSRDREARGEGARDDRAGGAEDPLPVDPEAAERAGPVLPAHAADAGLRRNRRSQQRGLQRDVPDRRHEGFGQIGQPLATRAAGYALSVRPPPSSDTTMSSM